MEKGAFYNPFLIYSNIFILTPDNVDVLVEAKNIAIFCFSLKFDKLFFEYTTLIILGEFVQDTIK